MSTHSKHVNTAIFGLFAILMLTVGPLVSQFIAMHSPPPVMTHKAMAHESHQHHKPVSDHHTMHQHVGMHHGDMGHQGDEYCGYCKVTHQLPLFFSLNNPHVLEANLYHRTTINDVVVHIIYPLSYLIPLQRAPPLEVS